MLIVNEELEISCSSYHIFFERARLLATIAKSFAQGNPVGEHRRMALHKNIDELCRMLQYVPAQDQKDTKTA